MTINKVKKEEKKGKERKSIYRSAVFCPGILTTYRRIVEQRLGSLLSGYTDYVSTNREKREKREKEKKEKREKKRGKRKREKERKGKEKKKKKGERKRTCRLGVYCPGILTTYRRIVQELETTNQKLNTRPKKLT